MQVCECLKCRRQRLVKEMTEVCVCGYVAWKEVHEHFYDICPYCGDDLNCSPGGGVKCADKKCGYWFCF